MLRYKTKSRPGLVALYDIRPGNGPGPFLQPRSPHGAFLVGVFGEATVELSVIILSVLKERICRMINLRKKKVWTTSIMCG